MFGQRRSYRRQRQRQRRPTPSPPVTFQQTPYHRPSSLSSPPSSIKVELLTLPSLHPLCNEVASPNYHPPDDWDTVQQQLVDQHTATILHGDHVRTKLSLSWRPMLPRLLRDQCLWLLNNRCLDMTSRPNQKIKLLKLFDFDPLDAIQHRLWQKAFPSTPTKVQSSLPPPSSVAFARRTQLTLPVARGWPSPLPAGQAFVGPKLDGHRRLLAVLNPLRYLSTLFPSLSDSLQRQEDDGWVAVWIHPSETMPSQTITYVQCPRLRLALNQVRLYYQLDEFILDGEWMEEQDVRDDRPAFVAFDMIQRPHQNTYGERYWQHLVPLMTTYWNHHDNRPRPAVSLYVKELVSSRTALADMTNRVQIVSDQGQPTTMTLSAYFDAPIQDVSGHRLWLQGQSSPLFPPWVKVDGFTLAKTDVPFCLGSGYQPRTGQNTKLKETLCRRYLTGVKVKKVVTVDCLVSWLYTREGHLDHAAREQGLVQLGVGLGGAEGKVMVLTTMRIDDIDSDDLRTDLVAFLQHNHPPPTLPTREQKASGPFFIVECLITTQGGLLPLFQRQDKHVPNHYTTFLSSLKLAALTEHTPHFWETFSSMLY